jgi:hypothetical protein
MNPNFANFYNELLQLAQKHADAGASLQEIYGAFGSAQNHVGFMLHEHYRAQATKKEWEETKANCDQSGMNEPAGEIPVVPVIEDN